MSFDWKDLRRSGSVRSARKERIDETECSHVFECRSNFGLEDYPELTTFLVVK